MTTQQKHTSDSLPQPISNPKLVKNPIWRDGPDICATTLTPAFGSWKEAMAWHEKNGPGCHIEPSSVDQDHQPAPCVHCGMFHFKSVARGPGGESSGIGRYSKDKSAEECKNETGWKRKTK